MLLLNSANLSPSPHKPVPQCVGGIEEVGAGRAFPGKKCRSGSLLALLSCRLNINLHEWSLHCWWWGGGGGGWVQMNHNNKKIEVLHRLLLINLLTIFDFVFLKGKAICCLITYILAGSFKEAWDFWQKLPISHWLFECLLCYVQSILIRMKKRIIFPFNPYFSK